ncbi:MAG: leucine-rich repeat domain-containing protein [Candidatus Hermodarchaeota archaeon]
MSNISPVSPYLLDLSGFDLSYVDLSRYNNLDMVTEVFLDHNYLTRIDLTPLQKAVNLKHLYLYRNRFQKIDLTPLYSLPNLQTLFLQDNELKKVDLTPLSCCKNLQTLALNTNQLTKVDLNPLKSCTNLEYLYLNDNNLKEIKGLGSLPSLKYLSIQNNHLHSIEGLEDLKNLRNINFTGLEATKLNDNNRELALAHLSREINSREEPPQLDYVVIKGFKKGYTRFVNKIKKSRKDLNLDNKSLVHINLNPINKLKSLETLRACNNSLRKINLKPLSSLNLEVLSLNSNNLKNIDLIPLKDHNKLRRLYIENNRLKKIDLTPLQNCKNLRVLYFPSNELEKLDLTPLTNCVHLEALNLNDNSLTFLDLTPLQNCKNLRNLHLDNNNLLKITGIDKLKGLQTLTVRGNKKLDISNLRCLRNTLVNVLGIKEFEGKLVLFHRLLVRQEDALFLQELEEKCKVSLNTYYYNQSKSAFKIENYRVHSLRICNCDLRYLPSSIRNLKLLRCLEIHDTPLRYIPSAIRRLKYLTTLVLSNNALEKIPNSIGALKYLHLLDLHGNKLTEIPSSLNALTNLVDLNIKGNPFIENPVTYIVIKSLKHFEHDPWVTTFKVNQFITLKLEGNQTNIYVNGNIFSQCKFLLLNIPTDEIDKYDEIQSIDDAIQILDRSMEGGVRNEFNISPETEFWGHCSNIQAWSENDYNTSILHSNLSFPLLKRLVDIGDPIAKKVFKEEIAERYLQGNMQVMTYLRDEGYLNQFTSEEHTLLKEQMKETILERLHKNDVSVLQILLYDEDDCIYLQREILSLNEDDTINSIQDAIERILGQGDLEYIPYYFREEYISLLLEYSGFNLLEIVENVCDDSFYFYFNAMNHFYAVNSHAFMQKVEKLLKDKSISDGCICFLIKTLKKEEFIPIMRKLSGCSILNAIKKFISVVEAPYDLRFLFESPSLKILIEEPSINLIKFIGETLETSDVEFLLERFRTKEPIAVRKALEQLST